MNALPTQESQLDSMRRALAEANARIAELEQERDRLREVADAARAYFDDLDCPRLAATAKLAMERYDISLCRESPAADFTEDLMRSPGGKR